MALREVPAEYFPTEAALANRQFDAVIIGAGIAGGLIAYELVSAGKTVLMLEAGPDETTVNHRNQYVENFYKASFRTPESAYPDVPAAPKAATDDLFIRPYKGYLDQVDSDLKDIPAESSNNWFKSTYERRVGGTTWHWLGTCLQLVPNDFKMRSVYDPAEPGFVDWPIAYEDLIPWYDRAAVEMGISGDPNYLFGIPRDHDACPPMYQQYPPPKYPMPKILESYSDNHVASVIDGMQIDVDGLKGCVVVSPTPQARNSLPGYQRRPQCCGNSSCIPVCPIQAKYDATIHVNLCRENYGRLFTLVAQSPAHDLAVDANGKIGAVTFRKWQADGPDLLYHDFTCRGDIVVVAAHAIETPKLLLNSTGSNPAGVANSSGLVGKYLMDHNVQLSYAVVKDPVYSYRGPLSTSGVESLKDNTARGSMGAFRIEIGNDGWEWPANAPYGTVYPMVHGDGTNPGIFGQPLLDEMRETMIRQIRVGALVEAAPIKDHDVQVSKKLDALGLPRPKVRYGIDDDPYCVRGMQTAIKVHHMLFKALGATDDNIHHHDIDNFAGAGHIMGTCRMGDDPAISVVDRNHRSHDHDNLYIVGSSVFPTVGASNPTWTIGAMALWAADNIKTQLGRS